jgi:ABC-type lipoprotein release transport system permease subunit
VEFASLISGMNWVILIVVFLMAAFGVANTMLMGTFERRREFAVVKALGMKPGRIVAMVVGEALVLGLLAVVAGALIALPLVLWLIHYPIDLTPIAGEQMFMDGLFRFVLRVEHSWDIPIRSAVGLVVDGRPRSPLPRAARHPGARRGGVGGPMMERWLLITRIALRNLRRQLRRSTLTASAMVLGIGFLMFIRALEGGAHLMYVETATRMGTGHIAMEHPDYMGSQDLDDRIAAPDLERPSRRWRRRPAPASWWPSSPR